MSLQENNSEIHQLASYVVYCTMLFQRCNNPSPPLNPRSADSASVSHARVRTEAAFRTYRRDFKITNCTTIIPYKPEYKETSL